MSYQVLARRLRPSKFSDVVDQPHVVNALKNSLARNQLHHAYLFSGTRGVGKTTLARIFAKCLNCERGVGSEPCLECETCRSIDQGNFADLIEIDAASRTGIEDTKEILDNVLYAPTKGRYKIYIIDEVHMLSNHSFNALLKTLEEPPAYVKFLLATTDPHKLPVTVLSRCLHFALRNVEADKIFAYLQNILNNLNIAAEPAALNLISQVAQGSIRDSLSILEMAINSIDNITPKISLANINLMLGFASSELVWRVVDAVSQVAREELFWAIHELARSGANLEAALQELLHIFHRASLYQTTGQFWDERPDKDLIKSLSGKLSQHALQNFYQIGLAGLRDLAMAPNLRVGFEMTLLRMLMINAGGDNRLRSESSGELSVQPELEIKSQVNHNLEAKTEVKNKSNFKWPAILQNLELGEHEMRFFFAIYFNRFY